MVLSHWCFAYVMYCSHIACHTVHIHGFMIIVLLPIRRIFRRRVMSIVGMIVVVMRHVFSLVYGYDDMNVSNNALDMMTDLFKIKCYDKTTYN